MNAIAAPFPPPHAPASRDGAHRAQRHSRAELEAMASRFVVEGPQSSSARRHLPRAPYAVAFAVTVTLALAWVWWPAGAPSAPHPVPRMKVATAAPVDAAVIRQRLQAARERSRREARSSSAYHERMAAADAEVAGQPAAVVLPAR